MATMFKNPLSEKAFRHWQVRNDADLRLKHRNLKVPIDRINLYDFDMFSLQVYRGDDKTFQYTNFSLSE